MSLNIRVDEEYFGTNGSFRDSNPNVFYVLGICHAIYSPTSLRGSPTTFTATSENRDIIEIVKEELKINPKVLEDKNFNSYGLRVSSVPTLVNRLEELGCVLPKRERQIPKDLPVEYFPDFLRGYFDSKLNVFSRKLKGDKRREYLSLNCNPDFANQLLAILRERRIVKRKDISRKLLEFFDMHDIVNLINFIYKGIKTPQFPQSNIRKRFISKKPILYLPQKKEKLEELAEEYSHLIAAPQ